MGKYEEMAIKNLGVSEFNVRKSIGDFTELLNSIEEGGVLEPLIVRPKGKQYEVVVGRRRLTAAKAAGLKRVPVIIKEMGDGKSVMTSLVENYQRNNLIYDEEYDAYDRLIKMGHSQHRISKETGIPLSHIREVIAAIGLTRGLKKRWGVGAERPPKKRAEKREIPLRHAREIKYAAGKVKGVLPKQELERKMEELVETVAPMEQRTAKKVINQWVMTPKKPIQEVKKIAIGAGAIKLSIKLRPKVHDALVKAATKRRTTVKRLIPIAVKEWLKQVGYYD